LSEITNTTLEALLSKIQLSDLNNVKKIIFNTPEGRKRKMISWIEKDHDIFLEDIANEKKKKTPSKQISVTTK